MRLSDLSGNNVVLWGFGREGRATAAALEQLQVPPERVTVVTDKQPTAEERNQTAFPWEYGEAGFEALQNAEVIIRSPGISRYREDVVALRKTRANLTTATNLWWAEHDREKIIAVTGTKGKSTTTSLIAHLLRAAGKRVVLAGNIGIPVLGETPVTPPDFWVLELSAQQISDLEYSPFIGVLLNLYREHLDWHLTMENYIADKLNLFAHRHDCIAVLNAENTIIREHVPDVSDVRWFGRPENFHVAGDEIHNGDRPVISAADIKLRGTHNLHNICAALTAITAAGIGYAEVVPALSNFEPLRHRLETVAVIGGIEYVNDSISTVPEAAIAAIEAMGNRPVTLLAGGFDRGQDYTGLIEFLRHHKTLTGVAAMPPSGVRLHDGLKDRLAQGVHLELATDLQHACDLARAWTPEEGVILLSPAAPSYGLFHNFEERGDAFRDYITAVKL